ncbi:hypothetical protein [Accumulibacter sp.]|nr:hypothetical protein [Accumulibacter sp.]MCM8625850.1 hypothetical protein [Accumulibacter sp.]
MRCRRSILCLVALVFAVAGCVTPPRTTLEPSARSLPGGREFVLSIPQEEIATTIVRSGFANFAGGGLIPALIDLAIDASRAKQAEADVVPLRDALSGYDFDRRATEALQELLTHNDWLGVKSVSLAKPSTREERERLLDASATDQVAFLEYSYSCSASFASIEVGLEVQLVNTAIPGGGSPADRLNPENLAYAHSFRSVIALHIPIGEARDNVQRWAASDGQLARQALDIGIARVHWMLEKSLARTPEAAAALGSLPNSSVGAYYGKVVGTDAHGTLLQLFDGQWVLVESGAL